MKILSIRQPWAHLIVIGIKDIENRTWYPSYRGPLLVHASVTAVDEDFEKAQILLGEPLARDQMRFGGVVGRCDLVGVVTRHQSPWFTGPYGFLLANPRSLNFVPWKGAFGLREVPSELLALLG